jgi:hypothetical protein
MPHAVFVETDLDGRGAAAAYAAELPGCATFAETDVDAVALIPGRVASFTAWLRERGEEAPSFVGGSWYEVERAAATGADGTRRRAAFSLDELPPSEPEFRRYCAWLELAREELADALDAHGMHAGAAERELLASIVAQDQALAAELGAKPGTLPSDEVDRLYAARDALTAALERAGPSGEGVRRALRLAIADDLRAAHRLREATESCAAGPTR